MAEPRERPIIMSAESVRAILDGRKSQTRRVVKPQPEWNGARWVWPIPKRAQRAGCSTTCVSASREWHEYMPPGCCPYGAAGDLLYVRETWGYRATIHTIGDDHDTVKIKYRADDGVRYFRRSHGDRHGIPNQPPRGDLSPYEYGDVLSAWWRSWRPSIHMPKWASRLWLRVADVRVQRVQEITEADAVAEGVAVWPMPANRRTSYAWPGTDAQHATSTAAGAFRLGWDALNAKRGYPWADDPWVWVVSFALTDNSELSGGEG